MPTIKQKKVFARLGETGGVISKAMEGIYANPQKTEKLTQSNGWKELIEKFIPDKKLAKVLDEGLEAGKTIYKNNNSTGEVEEVGYEPDYAVRHKYLETGLKLKGHYTAEMADTKPKENVYNFFFEPKFQQNIKNYDQNLKGQILNKDVEETENSI